MKFSPPRGGCTGSTATTSSSLPCIHGADNARFWAYHANSALRLLCLVQMREEVSETARGSLPAPRLDDGEPRRLGGGLAGGRVVWAVRRAVAVPVVPSSAADSPIDLSVTGLGSPATFSRSRVPTPGPRGASGIPTRISRAADLDTPHLSPMTPCIGCRA